MSGFAILAQGLAFPEGPTVADDGSIWCSELRAGRIVRIDVAGALERFDVGGIPNGTAIGSDGAVWFCDAQRGAVRRLDPETGAVQTIADSVDGQRLAAPNDLAFDIDGALVFTCPGESRRQPSGYVCRLTPDGAVERIADGLLFPNGICFSADGATVLVAETYAQRVLSGAWGSAPLSLAPLLATPGPIGADGVAIDANGTVYTCVYGAGLVRALDPRGQITDIAVPDAHPAGCAADPNGRWRLIVTGTEQGRVLGMPFEAGA